MNNCTIIQMYRTEGTKCVFCVAFVCNSLVVSVVKKLIMNCTVHPYGMIMVYHLPNMIECVLNVILTDETHWCI